MIRKMQRKFICIALVVLSAAMLLLTGVINMVNWVSVQSEIRDTMDMIAESNNKLTGHPIGKKDGRFRHDGRESLYENRYFIVITDGSELYSDLSHVASYTEEEVQIMSMEVLQQGKSEGFYKGCYFRQYQVERDRTAIVFLNCETKLAAVRSLLLISSCACLIGILLSALLISIFSRRAIQPMIENNEKQKRFITDASHELKTPLSVISANMDILALDEEDNEWVRSTQRQVGIMRRLVNDMVFLSRTDEEAPQLTMSTFDLGECFHETAEAFASVAEARGCTIQVEGPDNLPVCGDQKSLMRMISVLCDNAAKYALDEDNIRISLRAAGDHLLVQTENSASPDLTQEQLKHFFDRFYRSDASRDRSHGAGSFGIGLAIAQAAARQHGGDATAQLQNGRITITCKFKNQSK